MNAPFKSNEENIRKLCQSLILPRSNPVGWHLNGAVFGDKEVFRLQVSMTNHIHVDVGDSTPRQNWCSNDSHSSKSCFSGVNSSSNFRWEIKSGSIVWNLFNFRIIFKKNTFKDANSFLPLTLLSSKHDLLEELGCSVFIEGASLDSKAVLWL